MTPWHILTPEAVATALQSDLTHGLAATEAQRRRQVSGPNVLPEAAHPSALALFLRQFTSLIVWVLIAAALVSGLLHEWLDAGVIVAIVVLNAILGFVQEWRAERALAALKQLSITTARVLREGRLSSLPAAALVPGDLIEIEAGDHVPADARLVYAAHLQTQEAALTGESTAVEKMILALSTSDVPLADRQNMIFLGTTVTTGKGRALVVATGTVTELGRIATLMQEVETEPTPLQRRLEQFGHLLLGFALSIVAVVFLLGLLRGEPAVTMFLTAVSLAVAAIPEGLPTIVTITLALGVTRMVGRHALIRHLPAVETLGSTTVICTDKTGTLTKNEMTVTCLFVDGHTFGVTGEGYAPRGNICGDRSLATDALPVGVQQLLTASVLCNGATLQQDHELWQVIGDPTEGALLVAAAKAGVWKDPLVAAAPLLGEIPFDPERKRMTILRPTGSDVVAYSKGAPDVLLRHCTQCITLSGKVLPLDAAGQQHILAANHAFAQQALRVLAVASRSFASPPAVLDARTIEEELTFLGLLAMKDPLRPEVKEAVTTCGEAGIRTVMITGDHKETAVAIAHELGLLANGSQALSGSELDQLTDDALAQRVTTTAVYARVSAAHKLRIVTAWQAQGAIVGMTGDGVNDAPAVKRADIGIAMGLTGTDVTKEAADMVVTDDNFASIAAAVEEGRAIYDNIRKAVHYLLSCNLSEILLMLLATVLFLPLPLLPVQILWINLVTDGLPALALAVDPKAPDLMHRPPRDPHERFLDQRRLLRMSLQGLLLALTSLSGFWYCLFENPQDLNSARTLAFTVLVITQLLHAFTCRSETLSLRQLGVWSNKPLLLASGGSLVLQVIILLNPWTLALFDAEPLSVHHWGLALGLGILPFLILEGGKQIWGRSQASLEPVQSKSKTGPRPF